MVSCVSRRTPRSTSAAVRLRRPRVGGGTRNELLGAVYSSSRRDDARDVRNPHVRADVIPPAAGERPPERRLPHDHGLGGAPARAAPQECGGRRPATPESNLPGRRPPPPDGAQPPPWPEH